MLDIWSVALGSGAIVLLGTIGAFSLLLRSNRLPQEPTPIVRSPETIDCLKEDARIVFGPVEHPSIEILSVISPSEKPLAALPISPRTLDGIQELVEATPLLLNVAKNLYFAGSRRLVMRLPAKLAEHEGSWQMMKSLEHAGAFRGNIVNSSNRVVGQASFELDKVLNIASASAAIWQIAAIATAQKYLADINTKLERIHNAITDLMEYLETETLGKILGNYQYLQQLAEQIQKGEIEERIIPILHTQFEEIERESLQHIEGKRLLMEKANHELANLNLDDRNLTRNKALLSASLTEYQKAIRSMYLLYAVRAHAFDLKASLPWWNEMSSRGKSIQQGLKGLHDETNSFCALALQRIESLHYQWYELREDEKVKSKERLSNWAETISDESSQSKAQVEATLQRAFRKGTAPIEEQLLFEVELKDGTVLAVNRIENSANAN